MALQYVGLASAGQVQLDPPELNRTTTPAFPPGGGRPHFGTSSGCIRSLARGRPFRCPGPCGFAGGTGGPDMLTHSYLLACPASALWALFEASQTIFFRHRNVKATFCSSPAPMRSPPVIARLQSASGSSSPCIPLRLLRSGPTPRPRTTRARRSPREGDPPLTSVSRGADSSARMSPEPPELSTRRWVIHKLIKAATHARQFGRRWKHLWRAGRPGVASSRAGRVRAWINSGHWC